MDVVFAVAVTYWTRSLFVLVIYSFSARLCYSTWSVLQHFVLCRHGHLNCKVGMWLQANIIEKEYLFVPILEFFGMRREATSGCSFRSLISIALLQARQGPITLRYVAGDWALVMVNCNVRLVYRWMHGIIHNINNGAKKLTQSISKLVNASQILVSNMDTWRISQDERIFQEIWILGGYHKMREFWHGM